MAQSFIDDKEKMADFWMLNKDEFLQSYSYLTEEEYDATAAEAHKLADFSFTPMAKAEQDYTFRQSQQISMQTGLIGYLRADMDTNGKGFFSTWNDFRKDIKTEDFKAEFDSVINSLREKGNFLADRSTMSHYCYKTQEAAFWNPMEDYGVRVNTKEYAYLMRLNPKPGVYNLYCFCYQRKWLDHHIEQAAKGIRFIDSHYNELFRIPNCDKIRVALPDGTNIDYTCRYIDDYHTEVGNNLYHICEFAEMMEAQNAEVIPLRSSIPDFCYVYIQSENKIGTVWRGQKGYSDITNHPTGKPSELKALAAQMNERAGITKAQVEAMKCGSMFGWACKAADPQNYDENGFLKKPHKNRGIER